MEARLLILIYFSLLVVLAAEISHVFAGTEIIRNGGMESTVFGPDWTCHGGCTLTTDADSVTGSNSVKVTNRHKTWMGLYQDVQMSGGHNYVFTAYIKLLNLMPSNMYDSAELMMNCQKDAGGGLFVQFCQVPQIRKNRWTKLGGVHFVQQGVHSCNVYVQVHGSSVDYLIDDVSLQVLPNNDNWKAEANARIEQIRKANISVKFIGEPSMDYKMELNQISHEFGFGAAIRVPQIYDSTFKNYQNFFYDNFEWAVFVNALKWHMVEPTRGHEDYSRVLQGIHALRNHGVNIRGHNIFWGSKSHAPSWLTSLSNSDIKKEMNSHLNSIVGTTKGMLNHWDVNNENLHGDWYERVTGNPNVTMDMFRKTHTLDPEVKLFLNDWGVMEGTVAMAIRDQGKLLKDAGVPIYGIGVQSHIRRAHPDINTMKAKLDIVAEAGLPIWITEMSISMGYDRLKASTLHDLLTLYFSHPAIEGVLFWGFWDTLIHDKSAALFEGPNLTPNAAGTAYQTLYKTTWRTKESHLIHGSDSVNVRGFKGQYNLKVTHNGAEKINENFTLSTGSKPLTVNLGPGGASVIVG